VDRDALAAMPEAAPQASSPDRVDLRKLLILTQATSVS
jgi:hypothetical protein